MFEKQISFGFYTFYNFDDQLRANHTKRTQKPRLKDKSGKRLKNPACDA